MTDKHIRTSAEHAETLVGLSCRAMCALLLALACALFATPALAADPDAPLSASSLKHLSFEQLLNIEVTSVSKRPERLSETPSAIQVITGEDIRRSGFTSLADALRLASNVEVQQINAYAWVVGTRGFDALFSNKLLVMIDGRTVYTPLDAGVFWDAQSVVLDDVDRIEVVSGPGGSLWGSNAVNGVINIVTKSARETQGGYVSAGGGSFVQDLATARLGGRLGPSTYYRVYGQRFDRNSTKFANGTAGRNAWKLTHGGFRLDSYPSDRNTLTLQGAAYGGPEFNTVNDESKIDGQHLLGHWAHSAGPNSSVDLQAYFDRTWRRDVPSTISDQLVTYDADFQHHFVVGSRHDLLWGSEYRLMADQTPTSTPFVGFVPERRTMPLYSGFIQDKIAVVPEHLEWTVGIKLEHTEFSDFVAQPMTRIAWSPTPRQSLWGAVSRALRTPSRVDVDYFIPKTPPYAVAGGPNFEAEELVAYEAGYRAQPSRTFTLSLATYYNHYDKLYSVESQNPPVAFPYTIQNGAAGQSFGAELSGVCRLTDWWQLRGGYTVMKKDLWSRPGHDVLSSVLASLGDDPRNQALLQSTMNLGAVWQLDATSRYTDQLPDPRVPSYISLDLRVAARLSPLEVAVVGQNITDPRHPEYGAGQEIPRSVYATVGMRW